MGVITLILSIVKLLPIVAINFIAWLIYGCEMVLLPIAQITPTVKDNAWIAKIVAWLGGLRSYVNIFSEWIKKLGL